MDYLQIAKDKADQSTGDVRDAAWAERLTRLSMMYAAIAQAEAAQRQAEAAQRQADALERMAAMMEAERGDVERKAYQAETRTLIDDDYWPEDEPTHTITAPRAGT